MESWCRYCLSSLFTKRELPPAATMAKVRRPANFGTTSLVSMNQDLPLVIFKRELPQFPAEPILPNMQSPVINRNAGISESCLITQHYQGLWNNHPIPALVTL